MTTPAIVGAEASRRIEYLPLDDLLGRYAPRNPKGHDMPAILASVRRFGFVAPGLLDERSGRLVVGHGRTEGLETLRDAGEGAPTGVTVDETGTWLVPIIRGWASRSDAEAEAFLIADNRLTALGGWDEPALAEMLRDLALADPDLPALAGFAGEDLDALLAQLPDTDGLSDSGGGEGEYTPPPYRDGALVAEFGVPPFTVLDSRAGYWGDRKDRWKAAGVVDAAGGREDTLTFGSISVQDPDFYNKKSAAEKLAGRPFTTAEFVASDLYTAPGGTGVTGTGTSQFDPVLSELATIWYSAPGARVVDPFAGGPIRGLVAAFTGRSYDGVDIRPEQVEANRAQAEQVHLAGHLEVFPTWHVGDSRNITTILAGQAPFDLLLTCPPYHDLEQYSDDPDDLSRATSYAEFLSAYRRILTDTVSLLAPDAWAVIVTGPVRGKDGYLNDLPADTAAIMADAGMPLLNDHILLTQVSAAAIRAGRTFRATRKAVRVHQYAQVFHRGLPLSDAATKLGPVALPGDDSGDDQEAAPAAARTQSRAPTPAPIGAGDFGRPDFTPQYTPVEEHAGVWVKRDDAWSLGGASGAKARAMCAMAVGSVGIVTAGSRISPQLERASLVARALGIGARLHTGAGAQTAETALAVRVGATVLRHAPGRLSVIKARFRADAAQLVPQGWVAVPFGMDHDAYFQQVAEQAEQLPAEGYARLVVPVGSGMTLAAILHGLHTAGRALPVLGVRVGADPVALLDRRARGWRKVVTLVDAEAPYEVPVPNVLGGLRVDPHYEAKCLPFLRPGDLLWCVGIRSSATTPRAAAGGTSSRRARRAPSRAV